MTETQENQQRSVPKPVFTDAEAGAKTFPDSTKREFNYYTPAKRKQSHYEDVTVEVQPDPRHYLSQGWLYGFSDGRGGYPLDWTALKAWGSDRPEPERYPGSGGKGYDWPALGWHEFRDPNEEWELTFYRYNANVVRQLNQNVDAARAGQGLRAVEPELGALRRVARRRVDARGPRARPVPVRQRQPARPDQHAQQRDLGEQHAPDPFGPGPGAVQPDPDRGDRGLRRHRAPDRVERGPGVAGRPRGGRAADRDRRLVRGHLRGQRRVRAAGRRAVPEPAWCSRRRRATATSSPPRSSAPRNTTTPSGTCATPCRCSTCSPTTASSPTTTRTCCSGWLSTWTGRAIAAARTLQPLWSQPEHKPPRFEDGLDAAKSRFAGILTDLNLDAPKELGPVTTFQHPESPYKSNNTASNMAGVTLMNNQVGAVVAQVMAQKPNVTVTYLPSMIRVDARGPDGLRLRRDLRGARRGARLLRRRASSRRTCPRTTAG